MFNTLRKSKAARVFSVWMGINILAQVAWPTAAFALTGGPMQPEYSDFEPIGTTNMVNLSSGDFTYNLPLLSVPGPQGSAYPINLSYHSGASAETEASWVGMGWSLNPGAINRQKRGFPDDYYNAPVTYFNKTPKNTTISLTSNTSMEVFGIDLPGFATTFRWNNYKGISVVKSMNHNVAKGFVNLGFSTTNGDGSYEWSVRPTINLNKMMGKLGLSKGLAAKSKSGAKATRIALNSLSTSASQYGMYLMNYDVRPMNTVGYEGTSVNVALSIQGNVANVPIGLEGGISFNYTRHKNDPMDHLNAYGYMYSGQGFNTPDVSSMMDYYLEKETPYTKRDKYMAIPFSNADNFMVTGEGIGGGFRLHQKRIGHFISNSKKSEMKIGNGGIEIMAGLDFGLGGDVGGGKQSLSVEDWTSSQDDAYHFANPFTDDEAVFFRFHGDPGGSVDYQHTLGHRPIQASLNVSGTIGTKKGNFELEYGNLPFPTEMSSTTEMAGRTVDRSGRSSFIGWHSNRQIDEKQNNVAFRAYGKSNAVVNGTVNRKAQEHSIGEFAVYNENGNRYIYGLPVYNSWETDLRFGLKGRLSASKISGSHLYEDLFDLDIEQEEPNGYVTGEQRKTPYAVNYLLTEITTPDYIDRTNDGPTADDFGGYTKFNYKRKYGSGGTMPNAQGNNWFKWRVPYTGMIYDRNSFSDPRDDVAEVSYGYKEIYYIESIETKSHIAYFVTNKASIQLPDNSIITGSNANRQDGIEAHHDEAEASQGKAPGNPNRLEYLERIELYAKGVDGNSPKLLKKVFFDYDYSLMAGTNGNDPYSGLPNQTGTGGKLTLKKVWFEDEGIVPAKISPYEFDYEYPENYAPEVAAKYPEIVNYAQDLKAADSPNFHPENPAYSPFDTDRWGAYRAHGLERNEDYKPWVDQQPEDDFDPAAWQLKRIVMPSGGEIHIQYEQDEYAWVQNRRAMAMASLLPDSDDDARTYVLNIENDFGTTHIEDKERLREEMERLFVEQGEKIYFKFLYKLKNAGEPNPDNCDTEFIDGYASVESVSINENDELTVRLKDNSAPREVCQEFVQKNRKGMIDANCNSGKANILENGAAKEIAMHFLGLILPVTSTTKADYCMSMKEELSYLRIPMPTSLAGPERILGKKGGGLRVKRLMMYDPGFQEENGDASLYGTEYIYTTDTEHHEAISSGVATNEPTTGREENALVTFFQKREEQKKWQAVGAGKDKEQFEGPLGETILPAPQVTYSRVIAENIHKGKSNAGFSVTEFYTTKDYPYDHYWQELLQDGVAWTEIDGREDFMPLPLFLANVFVHNLWRTQGYAFIQYDINGKLKKSASYGGDPSRPESEWILGSMEEYSYTKPGEKVPLFYGMNDIRMENPGKEVEINMARKAVKDHSLDVNVELDGSVGIFGFIPIPFVTAIPQINYNESELYTHVTSKVIRYPAIADSVHSFADGVHRYVVNKAFDPYTGDVALTETYDGFHDMALQGGDHDGSYRSYRFPASHTYTDLGPKALNEGLVIRSGSNGSCTMTINKINHNGEHYLEFETEDPDCIPFGDESMSTITCRLLSTFGQGDLVWVYNDTYRSLFHVNTVNGNQVNLLQAASFNGFTPGQEAKEVTVEVLRSGRSNELRATRGSLTTYGSKKSVEDHPVDPAISQPRHQLAQLINDAINNGGGTIEDNEMPANLEVAMAGSNCEYPYDVFKIQVNIITDEKDTKTLCYTSSQDETFPFILQIDVPMGTVFEYKEAQGILVYRLPDDCMDRKLSRECFEFCPLALPYQTLDGVINASAVTFSDHWAYNTDDPLYGGLVPGSNVFETGERGQWRTKSSYAYNSSLKSANGPNGRIYKDAGVYEDFSLFNWEDAASNHPDKWVRSATTTRYSPHGIALEQNDAMEIRSTSHYRYQQSLPVLVAQNANYFQVAFESMEAEALEGGFNMTSESGHNFFGAVISNEEAHSGKQSLRLFNNYFHLPAVNIGPEGILVQLWVKHEGSESAAVRLILDGEETSYFEQIAQVGDWKLLQAKLGKGLNRYQAVTKVSFMGWTGAAWVDDIRIQPGDAAMTCYVYDPLTKRLLANFNDQHFGTYYQYNAEGKLIRTLAETEQGIMTLGEKQYHMPKQDRN